MRTLWGLAVVGAFSGNRGRIAKTNPETALSTRLWPASAPSCLVPVD